MNIYLRNAMQNAPVLTIEHEKIQDAWKQALHNLLEINTVDCPAKIYNQTGLLDENLGLMIRAGGGYQTPGPGMRR